MVENRTQPLIFSPVAAKPSQQLTSSQSPTAAANYERMLPPKKPSTSTNSEPPSINQISQTVVSEAKPPPQIDVKALTDKVEQKLMRRLVIESERRGKKRWG
ncbi:MAG: hypothetical protein F6K47_40160 [Symploca sp. SIO2E6]|nr:hypothetical protein [Symploca sp. SIO2E6]